MADDLIVKFFREDLTEAEEAALGERLSSSVEDALRFGQHAEASYRHYGLPEPAWPGGGLPPGFLPGAGWKLGVWMGLALLSGLGAWGLWKHWAPVKTACSALLQGWGQDSQAPPTEAPASIQPKVLKHEAPPGILPGPTGQGETAPETSPAKDFAPAASSPPEASPMLTPVHLSALTRHPHTNLEVVVKRDKPGDVTVRVVGPDGALAVMLYQGTLQPGRWAFDWNGRLAEGGAPRPGTYQIQVLSGGVTLRKNIGVGVIHKSPKPSL